MRHTGRIAVRAWVLAGLVVAAWAVRAAPASQAAATSQSARTEPHLDLDPSSYPAGVTSRHQYEERLTARLRDMEARLASIRDPVGRLRAALELAGFALTQVAEADLTRVWLLRRPGARPEHALPALVIATRVLFEADLLTQRSSGQAVDPQDEARLARLRALLAMETVLLCQAEPTTALRAARKADAVLDEVPQTSRPDWDLLVAACLHKAGKKEDALLRLQMVLRRYDGSPSAVAAAVLQSRMLADAGSYAAAIALLSEYFQVMPHMAEDLAGQPATTAAVVEGAAATRPAGRLVQCAVTLLRADLAGEWADKLGQSTTTLDRQTAGQLREQAARWYEQAVQLGPHLFRLLPVLRSLDPAVDE